MQNKPGWTLECILLVSHDFPHNSLATCAEVDDREEANGANYCNCAPEVGNSFNRVAFQSFTSEFSNEEEKERMSVALYVRCFESTILFLFLRWLNHVCTLYDLLLNELRGFA